VGNIGRAELGRRSVESHASVANHRRDRPEHARAARRDARGVATDPDQGTRWLGRASHAHRDRVYAPKIQARGALVAAPNEAAAR
jgi:hypothetical protein